MSRSALLIAVVLTAASCAAGETTTPGLNGDTTLTTGVDASAVTSDPPASAPASTAATPPTEPPATEAPADTTPTTESVVEPPVDVVAMTCASLTDDGYETRKTAIATLTDAARAEVDESCGAALATLTDAQAIEARMAAFNRSGDGLAATDLICDAGAFSLDITNNVDHPIGVHASLRLQAEGDTDPIGSTLQPLVIWSLGPGATQALSGEYRLTRDSDAALTCQVDLTAFDATPGDADASLGGEARQPELAGDDPALWLPALVAQGAALPGSNLPDAAAAVEDVRSSSYAEVLASTTAEVDGAPPSITISVCSASIDRPNDRTISIVYFAQPTDAALDIDSELQHGLFRRGNDGQWRWLTDSKYFDSRDFWDCGTPSVNL